MVKNVMLTANELCGSCSLFCTNNRCNWMTTLFLLPELTSVMSATIINILFHELYSSRTAVISVTIVSAFPFGRWKFPFFKISAWYSWPSIGLPIKYRDHFFSGSYFFISTLNKFNSFFRSGFVIAKLWNVSMSTPFLRQLLTKSCFFAGW